MSQSAIPANAAANLQGPGAPANAAAPGANAADEFLALLAQVVAPILADGELPAEPASTVLPAAVNDLSEAGATADAALACLPLAMPVIVAAFQAPTTVAAGGAPARPAPGADLASDVTQALASLAVKPGAVDAATSTASSLPGAAAGLFKLDGDDAGKAGGTATDAAAAAAATPPRVEAAGNGREVAIVRKLETPVGHGRWAESVGHEVRLLVERGVQSATLRLTPEHLGPVEVRIDLVGEKTNVWFGAAHADTRAALTDAIPKLREMFSGAGLMLGDTGVRQDTPGRFGSPGAQGSFGNAADGEAVAPVTASVAVGLNVGLVDAYA